MIRGRERDRRQEIRGAAERGGAREADGLYRLGQALGAIADEGAHPVEGGRFNAGEGWSDGKIAEALDTSVANVERTRRQLVEEGFEAVLIRKYNPKCARPRIFDGAAEAKRQYESIHPNLESRQAKNGNPKSQQALVARVIGTAGIGRGIG
jgi:hypothetical protein